MLHSGADPATVAERRGLASSTIESHIAEIIANGAEGFSVEQFVPPDLAALARQLFEKHGTDATGPIVEASAGLLNYGQAKIVRAGLAAANLP